MALLINIIYVINIAVSHAFGYGMMDAGAMTALAKQWKNVPPQHKCEISGPIIQRLVL